MLDLLNVELNDTRTFDAGMMRPSRIRMAVKSVASTVNAASRVSSDLTWSSSPSWLDHLPKGAEAHLGWSAEKETLFLPNIQWLVKSSMSLSALNTASSQPAATSTAPRISRAAASGKPTTVLPAATPLAAQTHPTMTSTEPVATIPK